MLLQLRGSAEGEIRPRMDERTPRGVRAGAAGGGSPEEAGGRAQAGAGRRKRVQ